MAKRKSIDLSYWIVTAIHFLPPVATGIPDALGHPSQFVEQAFHVIGYPLYLS